MSPSYTHMVSLLHGRRDAMERRAAYGEFMVEFLELYLQLRVGRHGDDPISLGFFQCVYNVYIVLLRYLYTETWQR
jgi:hypothetical protein